MSKASSARESIDLVLIRRPLSWDIRAFGRGMDWRRARLVQSRRRCTWENWFGGEGGATRIRYASSPAQKSCLRLLLAQLERLAVVLHQIQLLTMQPSCSFPAGIASSRRFRSISYRFFRMNHKRTRCTALPSSAKPIWGFWITLALKPALWCTAIDGCETV